MDTFEIKDGEIDVEDIMQKIKENVKKRRESGEFTKEMDALVNEPLMPPVPTAGDGNFESDIHYINTNWDIHIEYNISTHRPIIGRFLMWGRQLIHSEVKRYVDLIIGKQIEFNLHLVRIIDNLKKEQEKLYSTVDKEIENRSWFAEILEKRIITKSSDLDCKIEKTCDSSINYSSFNESYGGDLEEIRSVEKQFLEFFIGCKNVLDIGSGRGVFLELLREKEIKGYGIDTSDDLILFCKKKGLNVQKDDAISHLKTLNGESVDGVFIAHVIEHLNYEEIICLLKLCYDKMLSGSYIVIATPNTLNMTVSSNTFYIDPTHKTHVHPEVLKFLLKSFGFKDIQERLYQPFPEGQKLKKIDFELNDAETKIFETMNHNIEILNNLLFGNRDFAVIAKK